MAGDVVNNNPAENRIGALDVGKMIWHGAVAGGKWLGGALAGDFGKQQTVGQIIFDAVLSMFPVAGEITAARDAVSICIDMCKEHQKVYDRWEWIKLVLCLVAVVPVFGGILKGVGKIVVRVFEKGEDVAKIAADVVMFLNRMGHGNAYKWLRELDFSRYQNQVLAAVGELIDRMTRACQYILKTMGGVLPPDVVEYLTKLPPKLQEIRKAADRMVPQALKDLNECLSRVRTYLVEGTWSDITVGAKKVTTREMEGRLATAARDAEKIPHPKATVENYDHVDGWPNLSEGRHAPLAKDTLTKSYQTIESFSRDAPITADTLKPGPSTLARVLDTQTLLKYPTTKTGTFWLPNMAASGRQWREDWAVLHTWSNNGICIDLKRIPTADELRSMGIALPDGWEGLRVWRGKVSSQFDETLGRYLRGGEEQIAIDFAHPHNAVLVTYVQQLAVHPTNWKDVNFARTERAAVQAMGADEVANKSVPNGYITRLPADARHAENDRAEQPN